MAICHGGTDLPELICIATFILKVSQKEISFLEFAVGGVKGWGIKNKRIVGAMN